MPRQTKIATRPAQVDLVGSYRIYFEWMTNSTPHFHHEVFLETPSPALMENIKKAIVAEVEKTGMIIVDPEVKL